MGELTHFGGDGAARMVDVASKPTTHRIAVAEGHIHMQRQTLDLVRQGSHKKGDVLGIARIAGIMAAKETARLIPLCHPLPITALTIEFEQRPSEQTIVCRAEVHTDARTGVEMEALTGVQIALLTIYDMCKAVDRGMTITDVRLLQKSGGKSGSWSRSTG